MKKTICLTILFLFLGCSTPKEETLNSSVVNISELNPDKWTAITKQNLYHLVKVYHLEPFLFTRKIQIGSSSKPHSHPLLTLNTKYADQPNKLLSQWLHEELHWWATMNAPAMKAAIIDLKKIYPKIPNESRSGDYLASYTHLIICYLEYEALTYYLGRKQAKLIINDYIKKEELYPWIFSQVLNKNFAIKQVIEKHGLLPPPLN